jgi:hypothetical protein
MRMKIKMDVWIFCCNFRNKFKVSEGIKTPKVSGNNILLTGCVAKSLKIEKHIQESFAFRYSSLLGKH